MKFKYRSWPVEPSQAFPDKTQILRPTIKITLQHQDNTINLYALVDSGSDYCVFPSVVGKRLGIDVKSGKKDKAVGFGGKPASIYFHIIKLIIGGYKADICAGFSDLAPSPLLGHSGFFDQFEVRFNYQKREIFIDPFPEKK